MANARGKSSGQMLSVMVLFLTSTPLGPSTNRHGIKLSLDKETSHTMTTYLGMKKAGIGKIIPYCETSILQPPTPQEDIEYRSY